MGFSNIAADSPYYLSKPIFCLAQIARFRYKKYYQSLNIFGFHMSFSKDNFVHSLLLNPVE
jgi:hypothetical protein